MKAVIRTEYGSPEVMRLVEVPKPVPADDELVVKVHAVSLNRSDWEGFIGKPLYARMGGLRKPGYPILGSDIASPFAYSRALNPNGSYFALAVPSGPCSRFCSWGLGSKEGRARTYASWRCNAIEKL